MVDSLLSFFIYFVKYSYSYFIIYLPVGVNAKPIDYSTSGIYRRGTTTTVETDPNYFGWLCRNHFTAYDAQVVCLIWGFLP